jgi:hypothetical protein
MGKQPQQRAGTGRPVIFPVSNPTSQIEAMPADVIAWSKGQALVVTGLPIPPPGRAGRHVAARLPGRSRVMAAPTIGQPGPKILDMPIGLEAAGTRREFDSLGEVEVPTDRYWDDARYLSHTRAPCLPGLPVVAPGTGCRRGPTPL